MNNKRDITYKCHPDNPHQYICDPLNRTIVVKDFVEFLIFEVKQYFQDHKEEFIKETK